MYKRIFDFNFIDKNLFFFRFFSHECLPMCGNATNPYMTVELMENYITGSECAVQAQELIAICMQQRHEQQMNKQKVGK